MPDTLSEVVLILVASTIIILILISLIITALFINQKRKFRHSNEVAMLKSAYDQELLKAQLEIQTQTFESISRELHDNIGTLISIAMVHIKTLDLDKDQLAGKVQEINALLNEAMDTLRDISKSMNPEHIRHRGWLPSFRAELDRIRKTNLFTIESSVEGEPFTIDDSKQIILFRILQEALNNIVRHSDASTIKAGIRFSGEELNIVLSDDGKGFADRLTRGGSGLRNMKARAAMLPATLEIDSQPQKGTVVQIAYKRDRAMDA